MPRMRSLIALAMLFTLILTGCMTAPPDPESRSVIRARVKATKEVEDSLAVLDTSTGFSSYATSTDDRCYKGENNWKIKDGFANRCTVRITRFYGIGDDFRAQRLGLEDVLA